MKQFCFYIIILAAAGVVFYSGCKDPIDDDQIIPDSNVSYTQHLYPVLIVKCATASCHGDETRAGGLSLTTWSNTTSDPSIVFPFEPNNSRLVWTIDPQSASPTPMPPFDSPIPPLTENQVKGVRTWIAEGAKNN